jgi:hypothetical protein
VQVIRLEKKFEQEGVVSSRTKILAAKKENA